jgi:hypothetical protein
VLLYFSIPSNYTIDDAGAIFVINTSDSEKMSVTVVVTELADSTKLDNVILNQKPFSEEQLPIRPIIKFQSTGWMTKRNEGVLVTCCLELGTKSAVENTSNVCTECI